MMECIRDCYATIVHVAEVVRTILKLVFRLDKAKQNHKMCPVRTAIVYVCIICILFVHQRWNAHPIDFSKHVKSIALDLTSTGNVLAKSKDCVLPSHYPEILSSCPSHLSLCRSNSVGSPLSCGSNTISFSGTVS